jgi:predicted component of type VI protein secretion system
VHEGVGKTATLAGRIAHLPAAPPRPTEAGQQIERPLHATLQSRGLGMEVACLLRAARLQKQGASGLLNGLANLLLQGFQAHPF